MICIVQAYAYNLLQCKSSVFVGSESDNANAKRGVHFFDFCSASEVNFVITITYLLTVWRHNTIGKVW